MNKLYVKIEKLIADIQSTNKIKLVAADFRYFNQSVSKKSLQLISDVKIAQSVLQFYSDIDFINLQWRVAEDVDLNYLNEDEDMIGGGVNITNFSKLVTVYTKKNAAEIIDPYHSLNDEEYNSLSAYLPFDLLNGDGAVCFKIEKGSIKDELHLISTGLKSSIIPLNITCKKYIEYGIANWFFYNWQTTLFLKSVVHENVQHFYLQQLKTNN